MYKVRFSVNNLPKYQPMQIQNPYILMQFCIFETGHITQIAQFYTV
jgi:hypothetical protein